MGIGCFLLVVLIPRVVAGRVAFAAGAAVTVAVVVGVAHSLAVGTGVVATVVCTLGLGVVALLGGVELVAGLAPAALAGAAAVGALVAANVGGTDAGTD